jgi:hypothetical protein
MTYQKVHGMKNVIDYGEVGDNFYILLKGVVSVQIPNPAIRDRAVKRKDYDKLLAWKKEEFDPRAEKAREEHLETYQKEV